MTVALDNVKKKTGLRIESMTVLALCLVALMIWPSRGGALRVCRVGDRLFTGESCNTPLQLMGYMTCPP